MIVVSHIRAHVSLLFAVVAESCTAWNGDIRECSVPVIVEQYVRSRVAGYEDVWPAISVEVTCNYRETIVTRWLIEVRNLGHVLKGSISHIPVENILSTIQSSRAADNWQTFELANCVRAWKRSSPGVEIHIICNRNVQPAVAVVVDE